MSLITLDQYLEMHHHDTINTLEAARFLIKKGDADSLKRAEGFIKHQTLMESSLNFLAKPEYIAESVRAHNLYNILEIALTRGSRVDGYVQTEVNVDKDLKVKTEAALCYRYLFNIISNAKAFAKYNEYNNKNKGVVKIQSKKDGITQLSISDNGCGMNPEHIKKISEYGFSTKGTTGLGLAFMDIILPRINLSYDIQSEVGKGTKFNLNFYE